MADKRGGTAVEPEAVGPEAEEPEAAEATPGAVEEAGPGEPAGAGESREPGADAPAAAARRRTLPRAAFALLVAAVLAFAGFAATTYADAAGDDDLAFARDRDRVLAAGREHIARVNSIDAKNADAGFAGWLDATTGPLHDDLKRQRDTGAAALKRSGKVARATVTEAAVIDLDTRAGTAKVIASVRIELSGGTDAPATDRKRFEAALEDTGDGWKLRSLTAITVEEAS
ncbi:hypothetical protein SRB5_62070 [Streptomyces sp. RB5]|uniref:Mce-associated membrane protein n=1 Tax=Streptomyces smaragdinus TaxID=2585196 RepID=A0A7K0CRA1_9ACTN|nr:hypothetical protein [Streptomyces smaragdinus]MQY16015.1 hypothetical protein [Streptomyces smaragdinus]